MDADIRSEPPVRIELTTAHYDDAPFGSFRPTDDTDCADAYLRRLETARRSDAITSS